MSGSIITSEVDDDETINQSLEKGGGQVKVAFVSITSLFFMWGLLTSLNDILIPHLKALFTLSYTEIMLVQFCFFFAYFVVSLPAGFIVDKIKHRYGIILGLLVTATGCFTFYPAAEIRSYPLFLSAFFILASGITILQVAANPYVTILGSQKGAAVRLNLSQAFNSLGTTIGPLLGSIFILSSSQTMSEDHEALLVQRPYLFLAMALLVITFIFSKIKLPDATVTKNQTQKWVAKFRLMDYPHLIFGAMAIFLYVGAEVSIGSFLVNFLSQKEIGNLTVVDAGKLVSLYWGGAMVGRFMGSAILRYIKAGQLLAINSLMAIILLSITIFSQGTVAMVAVLSIGFFNSIMFPNIFTLSLKGLGDFSGKASGILCMAIVGGAILPLIQGYFSDLIGLQYGFFIPALCYSYILFYGLKGHRYQIQSQ